jgi:hypothetical protein
MHIPSNFVQVAKILNCDSKEAKSKSFLHFAFQPFQVFGSRLFASSFFGIFASRKVKVTSLVGGARYFNLENRRNPELEKVP